MINKAALLLFRDEGNDRQLLFVQAAGKDYYVFPGGKKEQDETIEQALIRETQEELASELKNIKKLGEVAGHTPDKRLLRMHLYTGELMDEPKPSSEIEELLWLGRSAVQECLGSITPMTIEHVIPFLEQKNLW